MAVVFLVGFCLLCLFFYALKQEGFSRRTIFLLGLSLFVLFGSLVNFYLMRNYFRTTYCFESNDLIICRGRYKERLSSRDISKIEMAENKIFIWDLKGKRFLITPDFQGFEEFKHEMIHFEKSTNKS